ncbi:peptidase associated/transthyretin-like domain-containing protein [Flavobacterium hercynium]|uniref:Carboxypeptidase regulatory-like domain-containing protein n=1 Tax=Flavobacterium hercynium TaxID=387094 RepID=A0A226H3R1_9FLAO|nr:hypothetical protein [Flavobacterium hercynium]OXA88301.1 hypothetical protein B0A66_15275 [Flavobacterium hercynium]SMP30356.1 hypothetical protein SAMN06265346_11332 [Flavobacterium hercynium]
MRKLLILTAILTFTMLFQSCLVSRCKRPQIVGYIYDSITRQPITNCNVGENLTDQKGYFELKELRYSQFTFIGYEAPTLLVNEAVQKEGYETKSISLFNPHGGGHKKGAKHDADTIFLKKTPIIPIK